MDDISFHEYISFIATSLHTIVHAQNTDADTVIPSAINDKEPILKSPVKIIHDNVTIADQMTAG